MAVYELGQSIQWGLLTYSDGTTLADLGGGNPTATVTLPDGTTTTATVAKTATGTYTATLTAAQAGRYRVRWTGSGANSGGLPYSDTADAWPADPRLIISLADARSALNVPTAVKVNDDELRSYTAAATVVVEDLIGPVLADSRVETVSGRGRCGIPLRALPGSITSVVEDGTTLTADTGYVFDEFGILWRGSSPYSGCWSQNAPRNVVVTYTVGASAIDPNVITAARELVKFWYGSSQQGTRPQMQPDAPAYPMVAGFAVPHSVAEKLAPNRAGRMPGMA